MKLEFENPEVEVVRITGDVICFSTDEDPFGDEFNEFGEEVDM